MVSHKIGNWYRSVAGVFMSQPKESHFLEAGTMTPEEFLIAGDQLVHRCPTWTWNASAPGYEQKHLPADKQFLITRGVPCRKRINAIGENEVEERETEDGWIVAEILGPREEPDEIVISKAQISNEEEEVPDLADLQGQELIDENAAEPAVLFGNQYISAEEPVESIMKTRVYDLSVTYDTYYQTPRMWLTGYDEHMNPLTPDMMFDDIMGDYAHKTVTIERHPCLGTDQVSIHPCNHAKMMKHFIDMLESNGSQAQVHHAIFVFLKFLSSVVPTIEYDFTMDLSLE
ncbi:unnamed protein product [Blepharisma stoltei]|uniref:Autophagy-related protein 3 n=1 Tax=Blepharisma stoltei TaxID=1481888 RepID=A0AAU9IIW4_9CILI|nr:unnamed protein product [Blepharisma stoltei]